MMHNPLNKFENRCRDLFGKGFQYTPCLQEVSVRYITDSDNRSSEKIQGCLIEQQVDLLFLKDYFSIYVYICMSIHEFRCVYARCLVCLPVDVYAFICHICGTCVCLHTLMFECVTCM